MLIRFWNRTVRGMPGGLYNFFQALFATFADRLNTILTKNNLGYCGKNVIIQKGTCFRYPKNILLHDNIRIGRSVKIGTENIKSQITINENCWIGRDCKLDYTGGLIINGNCTISEGSQIFTHSHGRQPRSTLQPTKLLIGENVWIGSKAIILPGIDCIGKNSIIGAGSVVTKEILPNSIVAGNPAKTIGTTL